MPTLAWDSGIAFFLTPLTHFMFLFNCVSRDVFFKVNNLKIIESRSETQFSTECMNEWKNNGKTAFTLKDRVP